MVLIDIYWYWLSRDFISTVLVGKIINWSNGYFIATGKILVVKKLSINEFPVNLVGTCTDF